MDTLVILILMALLLLLKGLFSGSEIAVVSADKIKLRHRAKQGEDGAALALKELETPERLLITTLVGTNLSTVGLTTLGTLLIISLVGEGGDLLAFLLLTPIFLILGEIVPKSVYQQKSNEMTPRIIYPLRWAGLLFSPLIFVFSRVARFAAYLFGVRKDDQALFITREQLHTLVEMAEHGPAMRAFNRGSIRRVIRFAETTVAEAMIPIMDVTGLEENETMHNAVERVRKHGFNRLPVYDRSIINIVGIVTLSTWDLMETGITEKPLGSFVHDAHYVSPHETIDALLPVLRQRKDHMAIVVDEFGMAVGIITMEDIVEEVVGEIDVGYNFEEYLPRRRWQAEPHPDGGYLVDARFPVLELDELLGTHFRNLDCRTVGGLLLAKVKHIPKENETFVDSGIRFTVTEASARAIAKLLIQSDSA